MAYSEEDKTRIVNEVCGRILGGEAVRNIMKDEKLPDFSTLLEWVSVDEAKSKQYARAMELRGELLFEETLEICDDGSNDWMERFDREGNNIGWQINGEHVQRSRLRVDTRKWYLSKLNPKKYGDKTDITSGGEKITNNIISLGHGVNPSDEATT
jgi:hypothetical protein